MIFSDGATATLISSVSNDEELIGPFVFGTDGRGADKLIIPAGGARLRPNESTAIPKDCGDGIFRSAEDLFMDGPEIFNFTLKEIPLAVDNLLKKSGMKKDEVDYYIFHQASKIMLEQLRHKLKIANNKFFLELKDYGNTVSSSIPIGLNLCLSNSIINKGNKIMVVGFGVGYSWAAAIIKII